MSYSTRLEDLIDHYYNSNEDLVKKKLLGWVGYTINGNMCFGIFQDELIVRVDKSLAHSLVKKSGIEEFKQAGDTKGGIVSVGSKIYENSKALHMFLDEALGYTSSLPPNEEESFI